MKAVRVHCGSTHVRGKARGFTYFVASLFVAVVCKHGGIRWKNTGVTTHPRRSEKLCKKDAIALADICEADYHEGYGSLHNKEAPLSALVPNLEFSI